ncbi:MAG TPA: hypothetical protein VHG10_11030 [Glycomyces sp.]|nr:hypothetical protein [Glycomyces sp.]
MRSKRFGDATRALYKVPVDRSSVDERGLITHEPTRSGIAEALKLRIDAVHPLD